MLDPLLPWRMAQASSGMVMAWTGAAMSSWMELSRQVTCQRPDTGQPAARPEVSWFSPRTGRSWYRRPDDDVGIRYGWQPSLPGLPPRVNGGALKGLPFGAGFPLLSPPAAMALAMQPWQAWLRLMSSARIGSNAQAWPMAFALIAVGMPQSAAWPAAEAGAHMLAATQKAAEGFDQLFANYRSPGGHAAAQIVWPGHLN